MHNAASPIATTSGKVWNKTTSRPYAGSGRLPSKMLPGHNATSDIAMRMVWAQKRTSRRRYFCIGNRPCKDTTADNRIWPNAIVKGMVWSRTPSRLSIGMHSRPSKDTKRPKRHWNSLHNNESYTNTNDPKVHGNLCSLKKYLTRTFRSTPVGAEVNTHKQTHEFP